MPDFSTSIKTLAEMFVALSKAQKELNKFRSKNPAFQDEVGGGYEQDVLNWEKRIERVLARLTKLPPHHGRHEPLLPNFHKQAGEYGVAGQYHESVFIMTKFPDPKAPDPRDAELDHIIQTVADCALKANFCPRIARQDH